MLATMTARSRLTIVVDAATSVQCGIGLGEDVIGTMSVCTTG